MRRSNTFAFLYVCTCAVGAMAIAVLCVDRQQYFLASFFCLMALFLCVVAFVLKPKRQLPAPGLSLTIHQVTHSERVGKIKTINGETVEMRFIKGYENHALMFAQDRLCLVDKDLKEVRSMDLLPFVQGN